MFKGLGSVFTSNPAEKTRKKYEGKVQEINALEPQMQKLSNEELRSMTEKFQKRAQGGEPLDSILVEAFAVSSSYSFVFTPNAHVKAFRHRPDGPAVHVLGMGMRLEHARRRLSVQPVYLFVHTQQGSSDSVLLAW